MQLNGESGPVPGSSELQVPVEVQRVLEVLNHVWTLLSECQLHPEVSSQLIGYLFFFVNASLFNSLMERGTSVTVPSVTSLLFISVYFEFLAFLSECAHREVLFWKSSLSSAAKSSNGSLTAAYP